MGFQRCTHKTTTRTCNSHMAHTVYQHRCARTDHVLAHTRIHMRIAAARGRLRCNPAPRDCSDESRAPWAPARLTWASETRPPRLRSPRHLQTRTCPLVSRTPPGCLMVALPLIVCQPRRKRIRNGKRKALACRIPPAGEPSPGGQGGRDSPLCPPDAPVAVLRPSALWPGPSSPPRFLRPSHLVPLTGELEQYLGTKAAP